MMAPGLIVAPGLIEHDLAVVPRGESECRGVAAHRIDVVTRREPWCRAVDAVPVARLIGIGALIGGVDPVADYLADNRPQIVRVQRASLPT